MIDLTTVYINLSNSFTSVQKLMSGIGYLVGITLIMSGLYEFKKHAESRGQSNHEDAMSALAYILGGAALVYLSSTVVALSNSLFGASNILSYSEPVQPNFFSAMLVIIKTAALLWIVRGLVLLVHSTKPGSKDGAKGLMFFLAGIAALNFENSVHVVDYMLQQFFVTMTYLKSGSLLSIK